MLIGGFSLGQLLRTAAQGYGGYLEGQNIRSREDEARAEREQERDAAGKDRKATRAYQIEQDRLDRIERMKAAAAAEVARHQAEAARGQGTFGRTATGGRTISGADEATMRAFDEANPVPSRAPSNPYRVTVNGISTDFPTEAEAIAFRDRNRAPEAASPGAGRFTTARLLKDAVGVGEGNTDEGQALFQRLQEENQVKSRLRLENPDASIDELNAMYEEIRAGLRQ